MKNFDQLQQQTHAAQLGFLMADAETALTFLEVARTTQSEETRARNRKNATVAYDAVRRFRSRVTMTDVETAELDAKLRIVHDELASFGISEPTQV